MEPENKDRKKTIHSVNRVERILAILKVLQSGWYSRDELLQLHPEYSERTLYRDMDDIESYFGAAIRRDKGKIHFVPEGTLFFQPLDLTYMEALSLYLLCQLGKSSPSAVPYLDSIETAMEKLKCLSHDLVSDAMEYQMTHTEIDISPTSPHGNHTFFSDLLYALEKRVAVLVEYDSVFENTVIQTFIFPYHLHFTRHAWYVTGRSSFHQDVRTFHLERIRSLKFMHDYVFVVPAGWTYENFRGNAWNMIRGTEDVDVELHFSKQIAKNVMAVKWHKTQYFRKNKDGSIQFFARVSGISEILWWILGYGDQVEVVSPPELRKAVKEKIQRMMKIYTSDETSGTNHPEMY